MQTPLIPWILYATGAPVATTAAYVLGRMTQRKSMKNDSELIAVVVDHGIFGLELESRYRSRPHAESRRRYLAQQGEKVEVMFYAAWLAAMTEKVHSPAYWDAVMNLEDQIDRLNAAIAKANEPSAVETTILPVVPEVPLIDEIHDRFDEIKTGIAGLGARMNRTDETLAEVQRMMDTFHKHITKLDHALESHTSKVGHVTAEMNAIVNDESAFRKNAPTNEFPRPSGGGTKRPARTTVRVPGVAEYRTDHEHRTEEVESGDKGIKKDG